MTVSADAAWTELLRSILNIGKEVKPQATAGAAGRASKELVGWQTQVDMTRPVITLKGRELGYRFLAAEASWIMSGDNRVATIAQYSKQIASYSDDGVTFNGAYGPKFVDQFAYVVETLRRDPTSRQAVMTIWRERPGPSKDVPCTVALQWLWREDLLHCVATMRSSDAWLGWVYDVFNFSTLSAGVALTLRNRAGLSHVGLGTLTLTCGSQHLYETHWGVAQDIVGRTWDAANPRFQYAPLDLREFSDHQDMILHLRGVADKVPSADRGKRWLSEIA